MNTIIVFLLDVDDDEGNIYQSFFYFKLIQMLPYNSRIFLTYTTHALANKLNNLSESPSNKV